MNDRTEVNRFGQSVCELRTIQLRGESITAANRKINANFKKGGFIRNQTVVLLTNSCGLTNSCAPNPPFLKLRLSLMRWQQF